MIDSKGKSNNYKDIISTLQGKKEFRLNQAYVLTWKHLGLNNFHIDNYEFPEIKEYDGNYLDFKTEDFKEVTIKTLQQAEGENLAQYSSFKGATSVSKDFVRLAENGFNSGVFIKVPENRVLNSYVRLNFNLDEHNPTVIDQNIIVAEPNSKITLIVDYYTEGKETTAFHNGLTKVFAKSGSQVNVVKIQRMNDKSTHFDSNMAQVESEAKVNWITVEIGSSINVTNYNSDLKGQHSSSDIYSAYLVDGDRRQDLYYTANHFGKKSVSNMVIEGVLKDRARKVFKGNIDFKRGSSKSKGSQAEEVLLLDPTVKTDTIPMLLCQEEDVDGEHAASVGKIDENQLFYLMSRGFDYDEAEKLVIEARFSPIFDKIPAEDLRKFLSEELRRRIINE
ncbi:Fe-S cluster assembly protein SufD [Clostridium luticellarii]|jgi:FeS assembly protein SufD|uniref:FeS cluster assembly protein SufB n=1 Tax=Clostridium luticellarii TaxID=1691940 RepID=A0A2T0BBJ8_9CLOT|nr:Fe-S cluster assembly protein SufD [Clostridium luticellarii]MCI1944814.1 Fe-S cluster assembly protein SufD [Clostridium luticellarii]MCI1968370.1 Fe-S cluster assembly protein SufD [Clostridium luticellarii]MCI1995368.1 Fe-S cluster assembly protein SufD [Clostridium luticellarii]MCI2039370.1 Fe-S cluster assembly protein SufD [Clostridium luticellarii]PRR81212.1 FeS cluster assembly protein SufB [Clostridium luticellarii]